MGLAMVHGIVQNYNGHINMQSDVGRGTLFEILLPKVEGMEEVSIPSELPVFKGDQKRRLLLVEDEPAVLKMAAKMLASLGYQVQPMDDGPSALELFNRSPEQFDAIITDHTMPGMSGFQLAKKAMEIRPDIPVILCTGYSETVTPEKAREAGIRDMLLKPYTRGEAAETLQDIFKPGLRQETSE